MDTMACASATWVGACQQTGVGEGGGEAGGQGGSQHTHPVTPSRPGSTVRIGGLEDESKWQVLKALRKQ